MTSADVQAMSGGEVDPNDAIGNIRKAAEGRRFALGSWHPDVLRVDPETSWLIWRDGIHWAWGNSAKLSGMLALASEYVILFAQAQAATPKSCPHCGAVLEDEP